jgi:hypothetical protein
MTHLSKRGYTTIPVVALAGVHPCNELKVTVDFTNAF